MSVCWGGAILGKVDGLNKKEERERTCGYGKQCDGCGRDKGEIIMVKNKIRGKNLQLRFPRNQTLR